MRLRILALLVAAGTPAALAGAGEWMVPHSAKDLKNPVPASSANAAAAAAVYASHCVECHGREGAGDGSSQRVEYDLRDVAAPLTDGAVYWKITHGVGKMPSHAGSLTDEQRWLTVNHLRTLIRAKAAAAGAPQKRGAPAKKA